MKTKLISISMLIVILILNVCSPEEVAIATSSGEQTTPVVETSPPVGYNKTLRLQPSQRACGVLALTGILSNVAFVTFTSTMPLWLVDEHGLPPNSAVIGWTLSAFSLAAAFGGIAGGAISNKLVQSA